MDRRKAKKTWSDDSILTADVRTMDAEECIAMLRSRGVDVPDGRVQRSQLSRLLIALQQSIVSGKAIKTPVTESRRRSSIRSQAAVKTVAAKDKNAESEQTTPTRPRRKSGPAALRKAVVEEEPPVEEEQEEEPQKKRRRSSSKKATKVKSAARSEKPSEEEPQEEQQPQEKRQEKEPAKKRRSSVTTRGQKRAAEQSVEEAAAKNDEEIKKKPAKRRKSETSKTETSKTETGKTETGKSETRKSEARKSETRKSETRRPSTGNRRKSSTQEAMEVDSQPPAQASAQIPQQVEQPVEAVQPVAEKPKSNNVVSSMFQRVLDLRFIQRIRNIRGANGNSKAVVAPATVDTDEEAVRVGTTVSSVPIEVETVVPAKKKGIVVTPKLEIIAMSVGVALFSLFIALCIGKSVSVNQNGEQDQTFDQLSQDAEEFAKRTDCETGDCVENDSAPNGGGSCFIIPVCIILVIAVVCVLLYIAYLYIKRYCDKFVSVNELKGQICAVLKDQAIASDGQAAAVSEMENPCPVVEPFLPVDKLKADVVNQLPAEQQSNLLVRFRMFLALRSLRSVPSIRCQKTVVNGKSVQTLRWVGKLD